MHSHPKRGCEGRGHGPQRQERHGHRDEDLGLGPGHRGGRARRGEARFVLLDALRDGPRHGYEMIKALEERSGGRYAPSPGTVYPTLQYLEDLGLVSADQEGERRTYHLTEKGRAELDARAEEVRAFWARFEQAGPSRAEQAEAGFLQEELHFLEQTVWRVVRDTSGPGEQEMIRRIRLAVEQCRHQVRRIATEPNSNPNAHPPQPSSE